MPNIIDLSQKTKMLWTGQENTIKKTQLVDLEVKGQRPTKVITDVNAVLQILLLSIRKTWPIHLHLFCIIMSPLRMKGDVDLEVKGQRPTKVITVHDIPPYGHAPTYQISLIYLERQKCYGPDKLRYDRMVQY
jgi:hypothetical protein